MVRELQEAGFEAFIVGGSVRDLLLGKIPKDFDVATGATPEEVQRVFPRCRLIGRRFRLAHVRRRGALVEVATFRASFKTDEESQHESGRILRDNVFGTVEEDALRRDFTINALLLDPVSGDIRDYVGGYADLAARRLRLIGDPEMRYREDPVRLLRAARFVAKLGVEPGPDTARPIPGLAALLEDVPPARLFEETCKLFMTGHALRSMEALQRFGLSATLFPGLARGSGPGKIQLGTLLREGLENTDERVRLSKPVTPAFLYATLLWSQVEERARRYRDKGDSEYVAVMRAAEDAIAAQAQRTSIPRRFSAVTRQIWMLQVRMTKTRGKRWKRLLHEDRFRAGYDFLLLRAIEDPSLKPLCDFWTQAQEQAPEQEAPRRRGPEGRDRPRRRYRRRASSSR